MSVFSSILATLKTNLDALQVKVSALTDQTAIGFQKLYDRINSKFDDAKDYADAKKSEAITAANGYADTKKQEAIDAAATYTDGKKVEAVQEAKDYADTKKTEAINAAATYTDGKIAQEVSDRNDAIATAKGEANTYTDEQAELLQGQINLLIAGNAKRVVVITNVGGTSTLADRLAAGLGTSIDANKTYTLSFKGDALGEEDITYEGETFTVSSGEVFLITTGAGGAITGVSYLSNPSEEAFQVVNEKLDDIEAGLDTMNTSLATGLADINTKLGTLTNLVASF